MMAGDEPRDELREAVEMIINLDRMIHEPSRLAVLTILRNQGPTNYGHLHAATGLSKGNLSNHLGKLQDAGLVSVRRHFRGKTPTATCALTAEGTRALDRYRDHVRTIERNTRPRP